MLKTLDLFSGIGGFSLGLERTGGFKTVAFCEIDPFCRAVLAKHWPGVPCHEDVRMIGGAQYRGKVDVVTGGVPCQPASVAGKRKGVNDDRWLWPDFLSVVRAVEPVWVLAENPRGIISLRPHGLAWIERELHASGYETQCFCIGADDVGAPQERKRIWVVAHRKGERNGSVPERQGKLRETTRNVDRQGQGLADSDIAAIPFPQAGGQDGTRAAAIGPSAAMGNPDIGGRRIEVVADTNDTGLQSGGKPECKTHNTYARWPSRPGEPQHEWEAPRLVLGRRCWNLWRDFCSRTSEVDTREWYEETKWKFKRGLGFAVDGPPSRLARFANKQALRACGNAVVPQVVEIIGQAILAKAAKAKRK
ncbi:MAG: DNA cytosine methyltransferase [Pirellulales bacterium]|nr:DNA cytosine methyltransferase [Pirellulales bacterium]